MIIYKIKNNVNGKIYIGLTTKDLSKRIAEHVVENKSYIQKALNKYGIQAFTISVIDSAESRDILCEKEKYWIQHYDCKAHKGYNLTDGGDGLINPCRSVRKRIGKAVSISLIGNQRRKGVHHTVESKKAISDGVLNSEKKKKGDANRRGKKTVPCTEKRKQQISAANKGKRKGCIPWNKGKHSGQIPWNKDHNHPAYKAWQERLIERNKHPFK
jgi:group I intron endonuclease